MMSSWESLGVYSKSCIINTVYADGLWIKSRMLVTLLTKVAESLKIKVRRSELSIFKESIREQAQSASRKKYLELITRHQRQSVSCSNHCQFSCISPSSLFTTYEGQLLKKQPSQSHTLLTVTKKYDYYSIVMAMPPLFMWLIPL